MTRLEQATERLSQATAEQAAGDCPRDYPELNAAELAIRARFEELALESERLTARARSLKQLISDHRDPSAARAEIASAESRLAELEIRLAERDVEIKALNAGYRSAHAEELVSLRAARATAESRLIATSLRLERLLGSAWGVQQPTPSPTPPSPLGIGPTFQPAIAGEPFAWDAVTEPSDLIDAAATAKQHAEDRRVAELEERRGRERARRRGRGEVVV